LTTLEALLLGVVQGLTEFFPVSSSGHLVIFQTLLGVESEGGLVFEITLHVATLLAIVIFYRHRILDLLLGMLKRDPEAWSYVAKLAVGTLPVVVVGLTMRDWIAAQFVRPGLVAVAMLVTGAILMSTRRTMPSATLTDPTWRMALLVGCGQAIAILPGISRSGTTVATALALGLAPRVAAEFSFLLGIIAIAGAAVLMLPDLQGVSPGMLRALGVGSLAALVSGIAAIWAFVRMLERQTFHLFAWYAFAVGTAFGTWVILTG
jgi:undecaprenyl-diphosphatase